MREKLTDIKIQHSRILKIYERVTEVSPNGSEESLAVKTNFKDLVQEPFNNMLSSVVTVVDKDNERKRKEENLTNAVVKEKDSFPGLKTDELSFDKFSGNVRYYQTWKENFEQLMGPNFEKANKAQKTLL